MNFKKIGKIALGILVEEMVFAGHGEVVEDVCTILDCCETINDTIKEFKPKNKKNKNKQKRKKIFKNKNYNF